VQIIWDSEKDRKLILERGFSLEKFAELIFEKRYSAVLKNPSRTGQKIFIIPFRDYTYAVPFIIDANKNIILKTAFPSRKYHKIYGGQK